MEPSNEQTRGNWTSGLERLWLAWEASDPDWLRLTQSLKTLLAVLLTMGIVYLLAPGDLFVSAIGAGFLMQCGEGVTRRRQQLTLVLCGLAVMVLAAFGAAVSSHREAREALIIAVAFLTFYLRRFVPRRPGFTAYAFVVCLLATVLPGGRDRALMHTEVLGIASIVAFLVFFYIRPANPIQAFAAGTRIFCTTVANFLYSLGPECDDRQAAKNQHLVKRALRFNQALADGLEDGVADRTIDELLVGQYDVWQTLEMLQDSLCHLAAEDLQRLPGICTVLREALDGLATSFDRRNGRQLEASLPPARKSMNAVQIELLRSNGEPDYSWVHLGGVVQAGRRLEAQAERLVEALQVRRKGLAS